MKTLKGTKKRVLWVTFHFPPRQSGGVFRPIKIYKYLDKDKFEVDFLTVSLWSKYKRAVRDDSVLEEVSPKPAIYRIPSIELNDAVRFVVGRIRKRNPRNSLAGANGRGPMRQSGDSRKRSIKGFLKGVYRYFIMVCYFPDPVFIWGWLAAVKSTWLHFRKGYDLIYTTSNPPSGHLPGFLLKPLGVKWVADFRDGTNLWNRKILGYSKSTLREKADLYYQKYVLHKADYLVTHSEGIKEEFCRVFSINHPRMRAIPNGYDEDDFIKPNAPPPPFPKSENELHVLHVGAWVLNDREIEQIIENLNSLQASLRDSSRNMLLHTVGNDLFSAAQKESVIRFQYIYHGVIPHPLALPYFSAADCYLLSSSVGMLAEGVRGFLAGKLWEYLRGGKPIMLFGPKDEAWQIIDEARLGFYLGELNSETQVSAEPLLRLLDTVRYLQPKVSQHSWQSRASAMQEVFLQALE